MRVNWIHYERVFLNLPERQGGAYALAKITAEEAYLVIADCHRVATLDFAFYSADEAENSLAKIDELHRVVSEFRRVLKRQIRKAQRAGFPDEEFP